MRLTQFHTCLHFAFRITLYFACTKCDGERMATEYVVAECILCYVCCLCVFCVSLLMCSIFIIVDKMGFSIAYIDVPFNSIHWYMLTPHKYSIKRPSQNMRHDFHFKNLQEQSPVSYLNFSSLKCTVKLCLGTYTSIYPRYTCKIHNNAISYYFFAIIWLRERYKY